MRKIVLSLVLLLSSVPIGKAIAQEIPTDINTDASALTGTTPATKSFENNGNGIQQINGGNFSGTLTTPTCTSRVCLFAIGRITPNGSELLTHVTQKSKKVSETAIPSKIVAKL